MNAPSKPALRKALEEIAEVAQAHLETARDCELTPELHVRGLTSGHEIILGLAKSAMGPWNLRPAERRT